MTAIFDYHQSLPMNMTASPYHNLHGGTASAPRGRKVLSKKQQKPAKQSGVFRKAVKRILVTRVFRMLAQKDSKAQSTASNASSGRTRTISENSHQSSILSDYDPMPTILEEDEEEFIAEFVELNRPALHRWDDEGCSEFYLREVRRSATVNASA